MDDGAIIGAGIGAAAAGVTTLWNAGGWAALQRRTIAQEQQMMTTFPDGRVRDELQCSIEQRTLLYVTRRHRRPWSGSARMLAALAGCGILAVAVVALTVTQADGTAHMLAIAFVWVAAAIAGAALGWSLGGLIGGLRDRSWNSRLGWAEYWLTLTEVGQQSKIEAPASGQTEVSDVGLRDAADN